MKIEFIHFGEEPEILIRAYDVSSDILVQYLQSEKLTYCIDNYFTLAEEITHRLVRNTERFISSASSKKMRVALREIIINAIEHGNLEISFEEKTDVIVNDDYLDFLAQRRTNKKYKNRKVTIDYFLNKDKIEFLITDEGQGFNHKSVIKKTLKKANEKLLSHGRGISMARDFFDKVEFNDKGNKVILTLNISQQS